MQRQIKFRAWENSFNKYKMVYFSLVTLLDGWNDDCASPLNGEDSPPGSANNVMQYTGLKDKNGKEIYEGDIVRHSRLGVVEWSDEFGAWSMQIHPFVTDQEAGPYDSDKLEVIGNIYENPELLNENSQS